MVRQEWRRAGGGPEQNLTDQVAQQPLLFLIYGPPIMAMVGGSPRTVVGGSLMMQTGCGGWRVPRWRGPVTGEDGDISGLTTSVGVVWEKLHDKCNGNNVAEYRAELQGRTEQT